MAGSHWSPTSKPSRTCGVNAEAAAPDSIGRKANAAPTTAAKAIPTRTADPLRVRRIAACFLGVTVRRGQPEAGRRLSLVVELDHDRRLLADDPGVVPRLDHDHARRHEVERAAVGVLAADLPAREEAHVRVHAAGRADDRLHVLRPVEAGRVDRALHTAAAGPDDVERHAADFLVFRALHG